LSRTLTIENSRQTTLHEFCDLGIPKPLEVRKREWEEGFHKIMRGEKVYDKEGNEL
jgi:hypothetical protein